jgi:hypothetical protein
MVVVTISQALQEVFLAGSLSKSGPKKKHNILSENNIIMPKELEAWLQWKNTCLASIRL